jgi:hypothetical protein
LASSPERIDDNPFWNDADKKKYTSYDLLNSEGYLTPGLYHFGLKNLVLSITNIGDKYIIRSIFYAPPSENRDLYIMAITNVIAQEDEPGNFKLHNWLHYYTRAWHTKKVGIIKYCYYPSYPFNPFEAEKANKLISTFIEKFDIKVNEIEYYIAENCSDIFQLKGFDFVVGMGCQYIDLCGFTDIQNNIIYSNAIKGEYYEHELCRLINKFYPNAHNLFINGLTEYFNESNIARGVSIQEHYKRMDSYLREHKEIDLSDFSFSQLDNITAPHYFMGLILCQLTLEKGGIELLKNGMQNTYTDSELHQFMEKELKIKRKDVDALFRKIIKDYAQNGIARIAI